MEEDAQTNIEKEIKELSENSLFSYKTLNKKNIKVVVVYVILLFGEQVGYKRTMLCGRRF